MWRDVAVWGAVSALSLAAASVYAQEMDGPAPVNTTASLHAGADDDIQYTTARSTVGTLKTQVEGHPPGSYGGVVPGAAVAPPVPAKPTDRPMITWPGFQMRPDGTSRVFIQSTVQLSSQPSAAPGKFVLHLPGAAVSGVTNRLPLETRFFNTPVTRVNIDVARDGVTLTLDLRAEITPVISSERGPNGYYFTYIDFPKGQFTKNEASPAVAPPAPPAPERPRQAAVAIPTSQPAPASASASGEASARAKADANNGKASASAKVGAKGGIRLGN